MASRKGLTEPKVEELAEREVFCAKELAWQRPRAAKCRRGLAFCSSAFLMGLLGNVSSAQPCKVVRFAFVATERHGKI